MQQDETTQARLQFYLTAPYPCAYLPEQEARSRLAGPPFLVQTSQYSELVRQGFRRSGQFAYRPACSACEACISVRVPVQTFTASRAQRRAWARHSDLIAYEVPLAFDETHFALYTRYQHARHAGGGMDQDDREQYIQAMLQTQVDTRLIAFHDPEGVLRMVSIIDCLSDGLSSVYTFFDPDTPNASYGTYNILWQIHLSQKLKLPYLYLGYWIEQSPKMRYKTQYRPLEVYVDGEWRPYSSTQSSPL